MHMPTRSVAVVALLSLTACRSGGDAVLGSQVLVLESVGDVRQGGRKLEAGAAVSLEQTIEVGNGRCVLQLPDGEELRMFADSQLRPASPSSVRLFIGKLWARVPPGRATQLEVETPNAVAGVRGTEFFVEVAARRTRVAVIRGKVAVANSNARAKETTVEAGRQIVVEAEQPPQEAVAFDPAPDQASWKALETAPAPAPGEETPEDRAAPGERGAVPEETVPPRRKSAIEREGDETKSQLKKEAAETEKKLKKEEAGTRKALADEEKRTRDSLDKDRDKAKGSVKDFLD
jgi:hypothetical protein